MCLRTLSEKAMATHSSTLAWRIPGTGEPGRLQTMGSQRAGHNWASSLSLFTFMHWRRKWQPTPVFLPGNPRDGGAWWAAVSGVTQSWTQLKQLSSSSSKNSIKEKDKQHLPSTHYMLDTALESLHILANATFTKASFRQSWLHVK